MAAISIDFFANKGESFIISLTMYLWVKIFTFLPIFIILLLEYFFSLNWKYFTFFEAKISSKSLQKPEFIVLGDIRYINLFNFKQQNFFLAFHSIQLLLMHHSFLLCGRTLFVSYQCLSLIQPTFSTPIVAELSHKKM